MPCTFRKIRNNECRFVRGRNKQVASLDRLGSKRRDTDDLRMKIGDPLRVSQMKKVGNRTAKRIYTLDIHRHFIASGGKQRSVSENDAESAGNSQMRCEERDLHVL